MINGTQLGFLDGVAATVRMENVVLGPNDCGETGGPNGAVLNIGAGSVTGKGLLFQGGQNAQHVTCRRPPFFFGLEFHSISRVVSLGNSAGSRCRPLEGAWLRSATAPSVVASERSGEN